MHSVNVLGTRVDCLTRTAVEQTVREYLQSEQPHFIVTANAEMYYAAFQDKTLQSILNTADLAIPDSVGILYAVKKQKKSAELYPGIELAQYLLATGLPVYVLGTQQAVLDKLSFSNIVGKQHGFYTPAEELRIVAEICRTKPKILFVALGAGKQEAFIARNKHMLNVPVMVGIGGAVDVLAGVKKRAPVLFQKLHLEWLYRLLYEPTRIFRQYKLMLYWLAVQRCSE